MTPLAEVDTVHTSHFPLFALFVKILNRKEILLRKTVEISRTLNLQKVKTVLNGDRDKTLLFLGKKLDHGRGAKRRTFFFSKGLLGFLMPPPWHGKQTLERYLDSMSRLENHTRVTQM